MSEPILEWALQLGDRVEDDGAACEGWVLLVRALGWSPVGKPWVGSNRRMVIGRLIQRPGLTIPASVTTAVVFAGDDE